MQETKAVTDTALKIGKGGLAVLIIAGIALAHYAKWVVDALYYLIIQTTHAMKDAWDRLPVHLDNLTQHKVALLHHWINTGQAAPAWWVYCRHGARDLTIALFATLLVAMLIQKPLEKRHNYGIFRLAATPLIAWLVAFPVWVAGGYALYKMHLQGSGWSYTGSNPWIIDIYQLTGRQHLQYAVLGILGGLAVKLTGVIKKPADEFQWLLAEQGWPSVIPGMGKRKRFLADPACPIVKGPKRPWVTRLVFWGMTASLGLAAYGAWLTLAGPAKGAA